MNMRIISGKYKGRVLQENHYDHIRPTTDKVKQALFTKLQFEIEGARVLDLFCGTGGLGIEAISRGAREVVFVDQNERSVSLTKKNLASINESARVVKSDAVKFLEREKGQYDLILIDPPYNSEVYEKIINVIYNNNLLAKEGTIVCEHSKQRPFSWEPFDVYDEKNYGTIALTYLTFKEE